MQLRTPFCLSWCLAEETVAVAVGLRVSLLNTIAAGVTPAVATATVFPRNKVDIVFRRDRNVPRILGRRIYFVRRETARPEIFIHG
jgi:hypothetical protein